MKTNKSEFIRLHPTMAAKDLVKLGKSQGVNITPKMVWNVRNKDKMKSQRAEKPAVAKKASKRHVFVMKTAEELGNASRDWAFATAVADMGLIRAAEMLEELRVRWTQ